jgi:large subunit ribosomal protein L27e
MSTPERILKPGKVVIVLSGRYAGKKAVVVKAFHEGTKARRYPHAIVAGLEEAPKKITRAMSDKEVSRRCKVKEFIKVVNYQHLMPTRYTFESDFAKAVKSETLADSAAKKVAAEHVNKVFVQRFKDGAAPFMFSRLRF